MIRELIIAGVAGAVGYVIGVRAGFDTGVRDYVENNSEMLDKIAVKKDKFDYPEDVDNSDDGERVSATFQ